MNRRTNQAALILTMALILSSAALAEAPSTGLIAYYPLDGNTLDLSGNGFHATPFNGEAYTIDRFGTPGRSLDLDGLDDYLAVPGAVIDGMTAGTLNFWVRVDNPTTRELCGRPDLPDVQPFYCQYNLFAKHSLESSGFRAQFGAAGPGLLLDRFYFTVGGETIGTSYSPSDATYDFGSWHMFTLSWGPTTKTLWLDGEFLSELAAAPIVSTSGDLLFGNNAASLHHRERLNGQIDDIRLYDWELGPQDILSLLEDGVDLDDEDDDEDDDDGDD